MAVDDYVGPTIGGMTYRSYDVDQDPDGTIGIRLADARMDYLFRIGRSPFSLESQTRRTRGTHPDQLDKYDSFYRASQNITNDDQRRDLLAECFPKRFGKQGTTPATRFNSTDLYGTYIGVLRSAKKALGID